MPLTLPLPSIFFPTNPSAQNCSYIRPFEEKTDRSDISVPKGACKEIDERADFIWLAGDATGNVQCRSPPMYVPTTGWRIKNVDFIRYGPRLQTLRFLTEGCKAPASMVAWKPGQVKKRVDPSFQVVSSGERIDTKGDVTSQWLKTNPFDNAGPGPAPASDLKVGEDDYWLDAKSSDLGPGEWWIGAMSNTAPDDVKCIEGFMGFSDRKHPARMVVEKLVYGNKWVSERQFPDTNECCGETFQEPFQCTGDKHQENFRMNWASKVVETGYRMMIMDDLPNRFGLNELVFSTTECGETPVSALPAAGAFEAVSSGINCQEDKVFCGPDLAFTNTNPKDFVYDEAMDSGWWRPDKRYETIKDTAGKTIQSAYDVIWVGAVTGEKLSADALKCITFKTKKQYGKHMFASRVRIDKLTDGKIWTPIAEGTVKGNTQNVDPNTQAAKQVSLVAIKDAKPLPPIDANDPTDIPDAVDEVYPFLGVSTDEDGVSTLTDFIGASTASYSGTPAVVDDPSDSASASASDSAADTTAAPTTTAEPATTAAPSTTTVEPAATAAPSRLSLRALKCSCSCAFT